MMKRTFLLTLSLLLSAMSLAMPAMAEAKYIPAPTIIAPIEETHTADPSFWITGLTAPNTRVAVYIDGIYNGHARVAPGKTPDAAASFAYRPFLPLKPGKHTVELRAEDEQSSSRSKLSAERTVVVHGSPGRPVFVDALRWEPVHRAQPVLAGLAPSGSLVDVYIDGVFVMQVETSKSETGVGHFAAYLPYPLFEGVHTATAITHVKRPEGITLSSEFSMPFSFTVPAAVAKNRVISAENNVEQLPAKHEEVAPTDIAEEANTNADTEESGEVQEELQEETQENAAEEQSENNQENTEEQAPAEEQSEEQAPVTDDASSSEEEGGQDESSAEESATTDQAAQSFWQRINPFSGFFTQTDAEGEQQELSETAVRVLQAVGWLALITAAALFVYQMQRHRRDVDTMLGETETSRKEAIAQGRQEQDSETTETASKEGKQDATDTETSEQNEQKNQ